MQVGLKNVIILMVSCVFLRVQKWGESSHCGRFPQRKLMSSGFVEVDAVVLALVSAASALELL